MIDVALLKTHRVLAWVAAIASTASLVLAMVGFASSWSRLDRMQKARCVETGQDQHQAWLESRRHELAATESGSRALAQARQALAHTKPPIPREAAICLKARASIDLSLRQAMTAGREYGKELTEWHAQNRAVDVYCAYALTIGAKR